LSPGQRHDSQFFETAFRAVRVPEPTLPARLAADKAYGSKAIRRWLDEHHIEDVIPTKANEEHRPSFDKAAYRGRNVIERCVSWLKEARRVATRYEKLARNFLAMLKLAIADRLLRALGRSLL
jgi:transposase